MVHVFVLSTMIAVVSCVIIRGPNDTTVNVGENARFDCQTNVTVHNNQMGEAICWELKPDNGVKKTTINAHWERVVDHTKYRVFNDTKGRHTLTVFNSTLNDSGIYECKECATGKKAEARLNVTGKQTQLSGTQPHPGHWTTTYGAIVFGAVGFVLLTIIIVLVAVCIAHRRNKQTEADVYEGCELRYVAAPVANTPPQTTGGIYDELVADNSQLSTPPHVAASIDATQDKSSCDHYAELQAVPRKNKTASGPSKNTSDRKAQYEQIDHNAKRG